MKEKNKEKNKTLNLKTMNAFTLYFCPVRLSIVVSLSTESTRKISGYHYSNTSNISQPYSSLFIKEYLG